MNARYSHHKENDTKVAVIGAGFFGIMTALQLAERGISVTLFDKNDDIMLGASFINQNRIHMGYHYPRSYETARSSHIHQKEFQTMFEEATVGGFDHFYCVASEGSKVSPSEYLTSCDRIGLPYEEGFPKAITVSRDRIGLAIKVPEKIYDADVLRASLKKRIAEHPEIELRLSCEVTGIKKTTHGHEIYFRDKQESRKDAYAAIVNATYSNINALIQMAGYKAKEYQYELCEIVVVRVPWEKKTGFAIMDGPFFGILPFGFSNEYLLYDVELSVLERSVGITPRFKRDISFYNRDDVRSERFRRYISKVKEYVSECAKCSFVRSVYVTRIVLPARDRDDARPSEVINHGNGFWSIFSGKVSMAIPISQTLANDIKYYVQRLHKFRYFD